MADGKQGLERQKESEQLSGDKFEKLLLWYNVPRTKDIGNKK